eukprot:SM000033S12378  [mRNA]  locus=s33:523228:524184:- [translate_table: standard]
MVVLGVPLGEAAHVGQEVQATLERHLKTLPALPTLHDSQLTAAILTRYMAQRPTYLQRAVPPTTAVDNIFAAVDVSLQQALLGLLDHPALATTPAALLQMTLPIGKGRPWLPPSGSPGTRGTPGVLGPSGLHLVNALHQEGSASTGTSNSWCGKWDPALQTSLSDARRDLLRSFPSRAADQVDVAAWASCSDPKAQARYSCAANDQTMSHLKALLKKDGLGLSRLPSITSPGASEWLNALPIYESLRLSNDLFRTAVHHHLGLPLLRLAGIRQCGCGHRSEDEFSLAALMLQCVEGSECNASHNLLRDAMYGLMREAG